MTSDALIRIFLLYVLMPAWLLAGIADWLCHRATRIEQTTGPKESLLHLLMLAEMAVPVLAVLFFEVNALTFAVMIVAVLAHQATALWDITYAHGKRDVRPVEQHIHSFLEMLPLMGLVLVAALQAPQFLALFGLGDEPARFDLTLRQVPLPLGYIAALLGAVLLLEVLPYLEELWRTLKGRGTRRT